MNALILVDKNDIVLVHHFMCPPSIKVKIKIENSAYVELQDFNAFLQGDRTIFTQSWSHEAENALMQCVISFDGTTRERNVDILRRVLSRFGPEVLLSPGKVLSGLIGRFHVEQFEEIRLILIQCIDMIIDGNYERWVAVSDGLVSLVSVGAKDICPDIRKAACELVRGDFGILSAKSDSLSVLVQSLLPCVKHRKWKLRVAGLDAITTLLSTVPNPA